MDNIHIWKALSILSVFYHQDTLDMVQMNMDQAVSVGTLGYLYQLWSVLPVDTAVKGML